MLSSHRFSLSVAALLCVAAPVSAQDQIPTSPKLRAPSSEPEPEPEPPSSEPPSSEPEPEPPSSKPPSSEPDLGKLDRELAELEARARAVDSDSVAEREVAALIEQLEGASLRKRIVSYERYVRENPQSPYAAPLYEEASLLRKVIELPPRPIRPSSAKTDLALISEDDHPVEVKLPDDKGPTIVSSPPAHDASALPVGGKRTHDGAFVRFGFGQALYIAHYDGFANVNGVINPTELDILGTMFTVELLAGGAPARGFNIGGRLAAVAVTESNTTDSNDTQSQLDGFFTGQIGAFIDWYPSPEVGFHLLGSVYYTAAQFLHATNALAGEDMGGIGWTAGIGYEGFVADEWSLGVLLRVDGGHFATEDDVAVAEDIEARYYAPGAQLTVTFN
jgi:hypothetical protein